MKQFTTDVPIKIEKPGYILVFLSNESNTSERVFFDELKVTLTRKVIQADDFFPFGMQIAETQYQNPGMIENQLFLYNGKELQTDLGLDWYDYGARMYDASIGRWHVIDPLADKYLSATPYNYVNNNPIISVDPNGEYFVIIIYQGGKEVQHRIDLEKGYDLKEGDEGYNEFIDQVYETLNYLTDAGTGEGIIEMANDEENQFDISKSDETRYDPETKRMLFNPNEGIVNDDGTVSSPAIQALHEFDHQKRHRYDLAGFEKDNENYPKGSVEYDKWEAPIEKKTIENVENPAAEKLNKYYDSKEAIRKSHRSMGSYRTKGPTTMEPANESARNKRDKLIQKSQK